MSMYAHEVAEMLSDYADNAGGESVPSRTTEIEVNDTYARFFFTPDEGVTAFKVLVTPATPEEVAGQADQAGWATIVQLMDADA